MPDTKHQTSKKVSQKYYVYIVRCKDGTLYTGKSVDIENRLQKHNSGQGAKYTRSRLPVELVYYEEYGSHREAAQRECEIKKLTKQEKEILLSRRVKSSVCL